MTDALGGVDVAAKLASLFRHRQGPFTAVHVTEGDLGEVEAIEDKSDVLMTKVKICLKSGRTFSFEGTVNEPPLLGDKYFWISLSFPTTGDIMPEGSEDPAYDNRYKEVKEGTIPKRILLLDGGYAGYTGDMATPLPSSPSLILTLVDRGAEAHNRPILEQAVVARRLEIERAETDRANALEEAQREYASFVNDKKREIEALLQGGAALSVEPLFGNGLNRHLVVGIKLTLNNEQTIIVRHEEKKGLLFSKS